MMEGKKIFALGFLLMVVLVGMSGLVGAEEESDDVMVYGIELEEIVLMINAWLATLLFILAFMAYRRDGRQRLLFVSLAFFLFAVKSFMMSSEIFFPDVSWIDPVAVAFEFAILLSFFYGVVKK